MRFPCPDVTKADFSAHEEYLTLYSVVHKRSKALDMLITVFDVQSGRKLRAMQVCLPPPMPHQRSVSTSSAHVQ
jgi:hypothetical protein